MPFDVTTFGESLLRLSVPEGIRLQTAAQLDLNPAGAEANIATLMSRLGYRTSWHSALPNQAMGYFLVEHLRKAGVNTDGITWMENGRVGTFYLEFAAPPRAIQVIYDRADSCITKMTVASVDWDALLDTRLLHLTGITPALSPSCAEIIQTAIARARAAHIPISFDVNFRAKLWTGDAAREWLTPVIQGIDLLSCGMNDANRVFGFTGEPEKVVAALRDYTQAKVVLVSSGEKGAYLWDGTQVLHQPALPVRIIDRIGAGDALACGVLHGWFKGDLALGLRYGVTLAALALSQHGDIVITSPQEVEALMRTNNILGTVNR